MITTRPRNNLAEEAALKGLTSGSGAPAMSPIEQESVSILVLNGLADQLKKLETLAQESGNSSQDEIIRTLRELLAEMSGSLSKNDLETLKTSKTTANVDKLTLDGLEKAAKEMIVKIEESTSSMSKKKKMGVLGMVAGLAAVVVPSLDTSAVLGLASKDSMASSLNSLITKAMKGLSNEEKAVVYQQLIVLLSGVSAGSSVTSVPVSSEEDDDSLYLDLRNALSSMVGALELNKVDVAEFHSAKAEMSLSMDKIYSNLMQNKHDELLDKVAENAAAREADAKASKVKKFFSYLIMAITVALTAVFSPATAVIMVAIMILSTVPVGANGETTLDLLANSIATGLENAGMSEEAAAFLANIIVVILTVVATKGACKGANAGMSSLAKTQRASVPFGPMTQKQSMKFSVDSGAMTELAFVSSFGGLGTTSSLVNLLSLIKDENGEQKLDEEKLDMAVNIIKGIESTIASLWSGKTTMGISGAGKISLDSKGVFELTRIANLMTMLSGAATGAATITSGIYQFEMADLSYAMSEIEAEMMILNQATSSNARGQRDDERKQKEMLESQTMVTESYSNLSSAGRALAEALA